jgi:hypothetical protein
MTWLVIPALAVVAITAAWLRKAIRKDGAHVIAWRFLSGAHLDGKHRTDATWTRPAAKVLLHPTGHASWWAHQPRLHRAGYRLAGLTATAGLGAAWWLARPLLPWLGLALAVLAVAGAAWAAVRTIPGARHRRRLLRPMSAALAPFLGTTPRAVEARLAICRDFADCPGGEHVGSLGLPDHWAATPDQKARVEQVIYARLGIEIKYQWRTAHHPMVLNVARAPQPPAMVAFADVRELAEACPDGRVLLGIAADGTVRYWDTATEDPMVAIHGGSRRGKTSLLLLIAAQEIRKGAERITGIDPKRVSLAPLATFGPAVELHNDPRDVAGQWAGIARFRALVEERYDALADDPTLEFSRALLIIDEVSQCAGMWAAHWRQEKPPGAPALPPVWGDVAAIVWMGAQARCHCIVAGQRLDYAILGGMLGSFGVRMLAGYAPQDYARLVGQTPFMRSQKQRGRFLLYAGGELEWVQLAYAEPGELRSWVLEGKTGASDLAADAGLATGDVIRGLAAGAGHLGLTTDAFRKRLERQGRVPGEFRIGNQPAWSPADLDAWAGIHAASTP